jgi:hypothetical protein
MLKTDNSISEILWKVIDQDGITKEQIADEVGVTSMTVYRWKTMKSFPKSKAVYNSLINYLQRVNNG